MSCGKPQRTCPLVLTTEQSRIKQEDDETFGERVIFVDGIAYNSRGFRVCGAPNQRGGFCARFGQCPFHKEKTLPVTEKTYSEHPREVFTEYSIPLQGSERKFKNAWKLEEHQRFLVALKKFGHGNWIQIADYVGTRTASQCQSHAQKYYLRKRKLASNASLKRSIFDCMDEDTFSEDITKENIPNISNEKVSWSCSKDPQKSSVDSSMESKPYKELSTNYSELSTLDDYKQKLFRIRIFRNGELSHGVDLELPDDLALFFTKAAQLLDMTVATKAYTRSGFEISSIHQICPGDILWISSGEEFIFPSPV